MTMGVRRLMPAFALLAICALLVFPRPGVAASARAEAVMPDFSGFWFHPVFDWQAAEHGPRPIENRPGNTNLTLSVGDDKNPLLKPWAAEIVKRRGDVQLAGTSPLDGVATCWPIGFPQILAGAAIAQILQQPDAVTILYDGNSLFRTIALDKPHPAKIVPSWFGNSVGHYEGDTLVVDTIGVAITGKTMLDRFGTPYTDALHVIERYTMLNQGKSLRIDIAIEDPKTFTMPWHAVVTLGRHHEFLEKYCAENNRDNAGRPLAGMPEAKGPPEF